MLWSLRRSIRPGGPLGSLVLHENRVGGGVSESHSREDQA